MEDLTGELSLFRQTLPPADSYALAAIRLDEMQREEAAALWLAPAELDVHRRLPAGKRAPEWLAGRLAAKTAVARLLGLPLPEFRNKIEIIARADGKPLAGLPAAAAGPVEVSISHSGNMAAALAAFLPCGLDVQKLSTAAVRVRDRFSSPGEYAILTRLLPLPEMECLTLLWAAKEALRKMVPSQPLVGFRELQLAGGSPAGPAGAILCFALEEAAAAADFQVAVFLRPGFAWALTVQL